MKQESYGLVFGINTFLALFFQTILTLIVADSAGLALEPPEQVLLENISGKFKNLINKFCSLKCTEAIILSWVLCSFPWPPIMPDVEVIELARKTSALGIYDFVLHERYASFQ